MKKQMYIRYRSNPKFLIRQSFGIGDPLRKDRGRHVTRISTELLQYVHCCCTHHGLHGTLSAIQWPRRLQQRCTLDCKRSQRSSRCPACGYLPHYACLACRSGFIANEPCPSHRLHQTLSHHRAVVNVTITLIRNLINKPYRMVRGLRVPACGIFASRLCKCLQDA